MDYRVDILSRWRQIASFVLIRLSHTKTDLENKQTDKLHAEKRGKKKKQRTHNTDLFAQHSLPHWRQSPFAFYLCCCSYTADVSLFSFSYSSPFFVYKHRDCWHHLFFSFLFSCKYFMYAQRAIFLSFSWTVNRQSETDISSSRKLCWVGEIGRRWKSQLPTLGGLFFHII